MFTSPKGQAPAAPAGAAGAGAHTVPLGSDSVGPAGLPAVIGGMS